MKRIVALLLALAAFGCVAKAQQWPPDDLGYGRGTYSCPNYNHLVATHKPESLFWWGTNSFPDPNAPATMVCCNPGGIPFDEVCVAPMNGAPPGAAGDTCISCTRAGNPISLSSGNTFIEESDISVPGLGGGLSVSRTWNSLLPAMQSSSPFMFGTSWRSNYEERLIFLTGDGYLRYLRGDGSVWSFAVTSVGSPNVYKVAAPARDTTTTITNGSPNWTLTAKSGEKRLFNVINGDLVSIIDRNGNTTQLSYDSSNRLVTVTDAASRHLYFTYPNGSSTLVSTITSDIGISLSYSYDGQGRLVQVTRPDATTVSFDYDAQSRITAVRDADGKILESHTYDPMGRGLTSSRANGVDSVTVSYPQ